EPAEEFVGDACGDAGAVGGVDEEFGDVAEGGAGAVDAGQGEAGGAEQVVQAGSPGGGEAAAERGDDRLGRKGRIVPSEHVEAWWPAWRGGVEHDGVADGASGEALQDVGDQVAFGVDDKRAATTGGVW